MQSLVQVPGVNDGKPAQEFFGLVDGANFDGAAHAHARHLGHELDGVVEIVGLKDQNAAQLLLRFGEGAISDRDLSSSLLEAERGGRGNALESVVVDDMAVGFEII